MATVYKNAKTGQPLLTVISTGFKTPILSVKFCSLVNPFRYPNSPSIPRRSVTCLIDPVADNEFLEIIQSIEKNENVDSILKLETKKENGETVNTGKILIKFQSKEIIPVYQFSENQEEEQEIQLEDEFSKGVKISVVFDILRYTKKNTVNTEHGISFKPTAIYYHGAADGES